MNGTIIPILLILIIMIKIKGILALRYHMIMEVDTTAAMHGCSSSIAIIIKTTIVAVKTIIITRAQAAQASTIRPYFPSIIL